MGGTNNNTEMEQRPMNGRHLQAYGTAPGGKLFTHAAVLMQE
jgi:hypothetical protein